MNHYMYEKEKRQQAFRMLRPFILTLVFMFLLVGSLVMSVRVTKEQTAIIDEMREEIVSIQASVTGIQTEYESIINDMNDEITELNKLVSYETAINAKMREDLIQLIHVLNEYRVPVPEEFNKYIDHSGASTSRSLVTARGSATRQDPSTQTYTREPLNYYDITRSSGITLRDAQELARLTGLDGWAETIWEIDQSGVNAFFMLGVAMLESSVPGTHHAGVSNVGQKYNNLFGALTSRGFIQYRDFGHSMEAFAGFITRGYFDIGLTTLEKIQPKYCPPNANWSNQVAERRAVLIRMFESNMGI